MLGIVGQRDAWQPVFLCHLHGKEAEEEHHVLAAFAQGGNLYGYGVQPVVEVFAEASFADGAAHIHIGGGHHAHVSFHHLLSAHANVFARFQHAEQSGLRGQRQFAHFVEENGAFVGQSEISLALADCAGERAFFVSEEFTVDGAFGYGAAVDGEVFLAAAG